MLDALEEAIAAGMLREEGEGYRFSHALIRQTIYDHLSLPRRQRLHGCAVQAIESLQAHNLETCAAGLAHHFLRAVPTSSHLENAIAYATRAGDRALAMLAYEEAATHYECALQARARIQRAQQRAPRNGSASCSWRWVTPSGRAGRSRRRGTVSSRPPGLRAR